MATYVLVHGGSFKCPAATSFVSRIRNYWRRRSWTPDAIDPVTMKTTRAAVVAARWKCNASSRRG